MDRRYYTSILHSGNLLREGNWMGISTGACTIGLEFCFP